MEVALVVLAIVVALVAVDAIARLDERKPRDDEERDPGITATQKIVVDLSVEDVQEGFRPNG